MIQPPRRSVTRFFIPLIDVLTLLFCIFLVMPLAKDAREANKTAQEKAAEGRNRQLEAELKRLRDENARLRGLKPDAQSEPATVRLLGVEDDTGVFYYYKGNERIDLGPLRLDPSRPGDITNQNIGPFKAMVEKDRQLVRTPSRLAYIIERPRKAGYAHPNNDDLRDLAKIFERLGVSFGVEGELKREGGR
jgi:hypothetical protein